VEIVERRENPLLDRVEIEFRWDHPNEPTPSLPQMIEAAAKSEPGADKKLVYVKNVDTRFGMSRTSGLALIYNSTDSASIEPEYVVDRHKPSNDDVTIEAKEEPSEQDSGDETPFEKEGGDE
jgi:small subunit ribosomal protein S24e|tara:strand:+ start:28750 stop:29115 length:366 start_codon:yes stop_codon:yes gene_type:complete